jgi:hypothetical protein
MAKPTPSPSSMPPPLLPNELGRMWGGRVEVRTEAVRVRWNFSDPITADGHRLRCTFACSVKAVAEAAERKLLGEVFLASKPTATIDDVIAQFAPSLQAAAANTAGNKAVAEWLAGDAKGELAEALRKAADKVAFGCGLEVLPPFNVDLESPSFQQQKLEAMERNLAAQRVAGQVEHFEKAAALLKQFDTLRQSAPDITPGEILKQISPGDQGVMLQTLLLAAGREKGAKPIWAVAGPTLVKVDPRVSPVKAELIPLPEALGPLRSVQPAEVDGQNVLLVGARSGVMVVNPERPGDAQLYMDPDVQSQMGFSRAIAWRHGIWGCHADAGIVGWEVGATERPKVLLRPATLAPNVPPPIPGGSGPVGSASIEVSKPGSPRNLAVIDESRLMFSIGPRLLTIDPEGKVASLPVESTADVVAILPDRKAIYVVRENGTVATHDPVSLAVSGEEHRGGRIHAATALPWLGTVRLLLATDEGPVYCLGTDDQLVTQYLSMHRGLRMLAAAADFVVGVSADRQRLVLWNTWDGKKPATDVSISAVAKHRVADVDFG